MSVSTSVCLSNIHISAVYQVLLGSLHPGLLTVTLLEAFLFAATGNSYSRCVFLCSVFLTMCPVTTTTATTPQTVVCSRASTITTTLTIASTSVGLAALGEHDVVLTLQMILRDTMRGSGGLATVQQQQQPQSHMPSQTMPVMQCVFWR